MKQSRTTVAKTEINEKKNSAVMHMTKQNISIYYYYLAKLCHKKRNSAINENKDTSNKKIAPKWRNTS